MFVTSFLPYPSLHVSYNESYQKMDMKVQHYHDTYEIYLQIKGERYLFLNDICHTLKSGDLYLLRPFEIHYTESRDAACYGRFVMNFQEEWLSCILTGEERHMLLKKLPAGIFHLDSGQYAIILELFQELDAAGMKSGFLAEKYRYSIVFRLLLVLSEILKVNMAVKNSHIIANVRPEIIRAIHYLNDHYQEEIDLGQLAETVHMSKYHFCRVFHKVTGATFLQYLTNIRLAKVHQLLLKTNLSLAEIAGRCGFASTAQLSRTFRNVYQVSPRDFRREAK